MIVPMKKVAIIMQQKDAERGIKALRSLGVVHVEHVQPPKGKGLPFLYDDSELLNQALAVLSEAETLEGRGRVSQQKIPGEWRVAARRVTDLWKRIDHLFEYSKELTQKIKDWQVWGDFDPQAIRQLADKGVYIKLFALLLKEFGNLSASYAAEKIAVRKDTVYCAVVTRQKIEAPFKEIELPKMGLARMKERLNKDREVAENLKREVRDSLCYRQSLLEVRKKLDKEIEFHEVLNGMGESLGLTYLIGYAPVETEQALVELAKKEGWANLITEPQDEDSVPTLLRNPKWIRLIAPVMKFLEILPGYRELDISLPFLVFFSIFFGILIGDAGYGLVYCLITFLLQQKARKMNKNTSGFFIFYILSSCAIVWGILTGTFFGQEWLVKLGIKPLIPALTDQHNIQAVCFFIGALHLTIAHAWRFTLKMPALEALADAGWILVLWTAFFLAKTLVLGDSFPYFGKWLLVSGLALVILFTKPQRNILKGIAQGLGTVALSLMNNFTDVVSYVRLFAVGLAGVAIADAFNSMAALVGHKGILAIIVSALILIVGHTLGIVLGPVSVLVHGVRLNVLEFSGHANVTWSGNAYKPLKE